MDSNGHAKGALQLIREAKGKTIDECARALGLNPKTWKRWELGQTRPRVEHLFAVASYLGVPVGELNVWPVREKARSESPERAA